MTLIHKTPGKLDKGYAMRPCKKDDFWKDQYEMDIGKTVEEEGDFVCFDLNNTDLYLQGNQKDRSYIEIQVNRCQNPADGSIQCTE